MQTVMLTSRTDQNGFLHLTIPVALPEAEIKVILSLQPILPVSVTQTPTELGWSPGFFEETFGAWEGDFKRESPGEYEQRREWP